MGSAERPQAQDPVTVLERGHIHFFFRPKRWQASPEGLEDVQRLLLVLCPEPGPLRRLLIIGKKVLPRPDEPGHGRHWGFVELVAGRPGPFRKALGLPPEGGTGDGTPPARPAGAGVYRIVLHEDQTHLVYALDVPEQPGEVQKELGIAPRASYVLSVKNPMVRTSRNLGLPRKEKAKFPEALQDRFRGLAFGPADPPAFLDHKGCEFVLIATSGEPEEELGKAVELPGLEEMDVDLFADLELDRKGAVEPLFKGEWG